MWLRSKRRKKLYLFGAASVFCVVSGVFVYIYQVHLGPYNTASNSRAATSASSGETISILFTGDIMLDRNVARQAARKGDASLFSQVEPLLRSVDAVVGNLEGTITQEPSVAMASSSILRFTFNPRYAPFLKNLGITAVSLSNNHTFDFGQSGYDSTRNYLREAGIYFFGSPHNNSENLSTSFVLKGRNVCLVGYEGFVRPDPAPIAEEIEHVRPGCDVVVATMHAGVEYHPGFTYSQQEAAHAFIDAGADVVIGTHPHIVEPLEVYKNKAIFYSLGNFMFDQDFSYETKHGLAVQMEWNDSQTTYTLVPIVIQHAEVSVAPSEDRLPTFAALVSGTVPSEIAADILHTSTFVLK